jgi:hypothetical protein
LLGFFAFSGWSSRNKGRPVLSSIVLVWVVGLRGFIEGYGDRLHPVPAGTFVLENLGRIEEFVRAYAHYVGASTMKALCDELKNLPAQSTSSP